MHRTRIALLTLLAAFTALSLAAVAPALAAEDTVYPIDDDHPLTESDAIHEFEANDSVSRNLTQLDATITVTETSEAAHIPGYYTDFNKIYVCMDYREGIARTPRFNLPGDYIRPRPGEADSLTSSHHARYARTGNGSTAISIQFSQPGRACFALTKAPGYYFTVREDLNHWVNDTTGVELPSVDEDDDWQHVPPTAFQNTTTYEIDTRGQEMTVQFDADDSRSTRWLQVPTCSDPAEQAVCKYREDPVTANDSNATLVLMSTQNSPPPVRYRYGQDSSEGIMAGLRDIRNAAEEFVADVGDRLGGIFGGGD